MPTVQRYGQQRVGLEALPGVRLEAHETPQSEGAQLDDAIAGRDEAVGTAIGSPIERLGVAKFGEIQAEERKSADETALLNASNQLAAWKASTLYDPTNGAFTKKGPEAFPLPEQVQQSFTKTSGDIASNLTTPEQKRAYARLASEEWQTVDLQVRRHVSEEMQGYKAKELQGAVANATDDAIRNADDPTLVGQSLTKAIGFITTNAPRLGMGPEAVQEQVRGVTSDVHVGVIRNLLANEQDTKASIYFDAHKDGIAATQLDNVQKALEAGSVRSQSQKAADGIIAQGGSLTDQIAKTKDLDPKVRDATRERLEQNDTIQQKAKREQLAGDMNQAYNILDQTPDVTKIPTPLWSSFTGPERSAMLEYAKHRAEGTPVKTDPVALYSLISQAGDKPDDFVKVNLLSYKARLDDADFKQLAEMQKTIKNGDRAKADRDLAPFRTREQILHDTLVNYGIPPEEKAQTGAQTNAVANLRRMLDTRVQAQETITGKKATNDDIQKTLDGLMSQSVQVPGSFWHLWQPQSKRVVELTIDDVPPADKTQITDALTRAHRPASDATILDLYLERLARRPQ